MINGVNTTGYICERLIVLKRGLATGQRWF
jgi:hypothetical protein